MYPLFYRLTGELSSIATSIKKRHLISQRAFIGSWLNFFDHIETTLYLALGPLFLFHPSEHSSSIWILGLLSGGLGKLAFSFIWSLLFRLFGLRLILACSWLGLALSSFVFGIYGLMNEGFFLSILIIMCLRFCQSLCSSAQTHSCRVWIFSELKKESKRALQTSAFFGLSTPLGMMCGLGIALGISLHSPLEKVWPYIYLIISSIALAQSAALWRYLKTDSILESRHHQWPHLHEIAICALMSSFGYCTYYWACVFLPMQLEGENKIWAQTEAMAYDTLLMLPLGFLSTYLGSRLTVRLCTIGSILAILLTVSSGLSTSYLRWSLLVLGVLCSCAHSAWLKNHLNPDSFFPSSLIGGAVGALIGSWGFYWAQNQGKELLLMAALPFLLISLLLALYNNEPKSKETKNPLHIS